MKTKLEQKVKELYPEAEIEPCKYLDTVLFNDPKLGCYLYLQKEYNKPVRNSYCIVKESLNGCKVIKEDIIINF